MIIVKIELHSAVTGKVSEIGRMEIANDGKTRDPRRGDYSVCLMQRGTTDRVRRRGEVKNHARLAYSVWVLIAKALASVGFAVRNDLAAPATTPDPANAEALDAEPE